MRKLTGVLAVLALATAACSSGTSAKGVATAPTRSVTASVSAGAADDPQGYVTCMRAHGVAVQGPDARGQISLPTGTDPNSPTFQAAQRTCRTFMPGMMTGSPRQPDVAAGVAQMVKYAQCMRAHGLPNFPDPKADGSLRLDKSSGIDPKSVQFQSAARACQSVQPKGEKKP